jgi:hypothetical protein
MARGSFYNRNKLSGFCILVVGKFRTGGLVGPYE